MPYQFSLTESTSKNVSTALKSSLILIPVGCVALTVAYIETNGAWEVLGWLIFENVIISLVWLYVIYNQNKVRLSYSETRVSQLESRFNTRPEPVRETEPETEPVRKSVPFEIHTEPEKLEDRQLSDKQFRELMQQIEKENERTPAGYRHYNSAPTPPTRGYYIDAKTRQIREIR